MDVSTQGIDSHLDLAILNILAETFDWLEKSHFPYCFLFINKLQHLLHEFPEIFSPSLDSEIFGTSEKVGKSME